MLIKIPTSAPFDVQEAFRGVSELLDKILGGLNLDFKGRRIINAGSAQQDGDYVTRADVVRLIRASGGTINNDGTPIGNSGQAAGTASLVAGSSAPNAARQLANDLARVSLRA